MGGQQAGGRSSALWEMRKPLHAFRWGEESTVGDGAGKRNAKGGGRSRLALVIGYFLTRWGVSPRMPQGISIHRR